MQTLIPKPTYAAPKLVSYTPDSWQARAIAEAETLHRAGKSGMLVLMLGNGPPRWWVAHPKGVDGR